MLFDLRSHLNIQFTLQNIESYYVLLVLCVNSAVPQSESKPPTEKVVVFRVVWLV